MEQNLDNLKRKAAPGTDGLTAHEGSIKRGKTFP